MQKQVNNPKSELKSLTSALKAKSQVAQCCAKTSAIVAGCHD